MIVIDKYTDQEIVDALLSRDINITKEYLYKKCYPLFASIYSRYYTDCENVIEFINEIYVYILTPRRSTGKSKLADFSFRCSLTMWLKIVSENLCHQLYTKKLKVSSILDDDDRNNWSNYSLESSFNKLDIEDLKKILEMMPNEKYRKVIEYRYFMGDSNENTALKLSLTMSNYYNVHLRAKAQFCSILRKEGLI